MKKKTIYTCQQCGSQSPRWVGKCPDCNQWNSFVEENIVSCNISSNHKSALVADFKEQQKKPLRLNEIILTDKYRVLTGMQELDRVFGGGIVQGSVMLIGGSPGIGKSTIVLQIASIISKQNKKVLYITGEESIQQTGLRAKRLQIKENDNLYLISELNLNVILNLMKKFKPEIVIIDSIQVIYHPDITSSPGSVSQVRECSGILTQVAKSLNISLFLVGHVTKDGSLAGPRVLEHIVDAVFYFEGERYSSYRILRAIKNRFGSTNEIGVFEMTSLGLKEVKNPSEIFLSERPKGVCGSVVVPIVEGTRPLLVEVQALVSNSSFSMVRHKSEGFDVNRLSLLISVLEKKNGIQLMDQDIFVNVVGGIKVIDPAIDLSMSVAIFSAFNDKSIEEDMIILGEVGLSSEIRSVSYIDIRLKEAQKLGFKKAIIPKYNYQSRKDIRDCMKEIYPVSKIEEVIEIIK